MNRFLFPSFFVAVLATPAARAADRIELRQGDRVVLLGNTLVEREQRFGYWETVLTTRYPDRDVTFRNLGWSGDTVLGEARAGFGSPADGFRHLTEHVLALKPTVLLVAYGT
ncbi:MAG: GDSL family lipase, partial [Planctomycetes bacterium]|nr:GDSL family lipase [Planctomycetota bacterium]